MSKFTAADVITYIESEGTPLPLVAERMLRYLATLLAEREKNVDPSKESCQCVHCLADGPHDSDCAVHNEPALPIGECDCSKNAAPSSGQLGEVTGEGETPRTDAFKRHYDGGDKANSWDYVDVEDCESLERELAALRGDGMVSVPREPTFAMIEAADPNDDLDVTWRKMIDAAGRAG